MLRHVGNQFPFEARPAGKWGRAQILYNELPNEVSGPKGISKFDFHDQFQKLVGTTLKDFIDITFVACAGAASSNHLGFARDYFEKARHDGMRIGNDETVRAVLQRIAADAATHNRLAVQFQQKDRNYAAYDFNTLMVYPLIRPWPASATQQMGDDRMLAPIPGLLTFRLSTGIYYDMRQQYKGTFDQFFGHLLNAYVGRLLRSFVPYTSLLSGDDIRRTYPEKCGKVPDWVIIDGRTAILIECKAARIHRLTYVSGDETDLRKNVRDVLGGLQQLFEFRAAAMRKVKGLEQLAGCDQFIPIIVTWEPLYLSGSGPFKDVLRSELAEPMRQMEWSILDLDQLEVLQACLSGGLDIAETFRRTITNDIDALARSLLAATSRTYAHSLLAEKEKELYERLGVPRASSPPGPHSAQNPE